MKCMLCRQLAQATVSKLPTSHALISQRLNIFLDVKIDRTTHLVFKPHTGLLNSNKVQTAQQWGIPVVSVQWLADSIRAARLLDVGGTEPRAATSSGRSLPQCSVQSTGQSLCSNICEKAVACRVGSAIPAGLRRSLITAVCRHGAARRQRRRTGDRIGPAPGRQRTSP